MQQADGAVWGWAALLSRPLPRSWACFMTCEIEADSLSEQPGTWNATVETWVQYDPTFLGMYAQF